MCDKIEVFLLNCMLVLSQSLEYAYISLIIWFYVVSGYDLANLHVLICDDSFQIRSLLKFLT